MNTWKELCEIIEEEISQVTKRGEVAANEWGHLKEAVTVYEKIKKIELMDEGSGDDSYASGRSYARGYRDGSRDGSQESSGRWSNSDGSYARGRSRRTGRYVSRDASGHGEKEKMLSHLEKMKAETTDNWVKQTIQECIERIEDEE